jgi:fused signal recognition particle receptor
MEVDRARLAAPMQIDPIYLILGAAFVVLLVVGFLFWKRGDSDDTVAIPRRPRSRISGLGGALRNAWGSGMGKGDWDSIEEVLLGADVGVVATTAVIEGVRRQGPETYEGAIELLGAGLKSQFESADRSLSLTTSPAVILVVGVNGAGKTTTIAKLAHRFLHEGRSVVLGAGDTFRAAAADQLVTWGDRLDVRVVRGNEGADPGSVVFDTLAAARAAETDIVLIDTAGRLHGKKNLMAELEKIHRVASGGGEVAEVLLVLDATAGQNGLVQVREFATSVPLTGVVLTKLDGTARGGIVVAVEKELGVPVKFVGLGETMEDLEVFDPNRFVDELLEQS